MPKLPHPAPMTPRASAASLRDSRQRYQRIFGELDLDPEERNQEQCVNEQKHVGVNCGPTNKCSPAPGEARQDEPGHSKQRSKVIETFQKYSLTRTNAWVFQSQYVPSDKSQARSSQMTVLGTQASGSQASC